jgi:PAS domain S-box-containing protein
MSIKKDFYKRISLIVIVSTIALSAISIMVQRNILLKDMKDKGDSIARTLSVVVKDSMLTYDYVTMERYAREVVNDRAIQYLKISREDGEIMAEAKGARYEGESYDAAYPVKIGDAVLGNIHMSFSMERVDIISKGIIISALAFIVLLHGIALVVNNAIIDSLVIRPLNLLLAATKKIKDGSLKNRIEIKSKNEFGVLASAFNEMAATLESNFEEIKGKQKEVLTEKGKLETIVMSIADGVFVSNSEGVLISFNRAAEEISGYAEDEAVGLHCEEVFKTRLCEDACALHNEDKIIRNKETEIITKDGRRLAVSVSSAILRDSDGKVIGGVQTFRDITAEKQRQALLCQTEKLAAIGHLSAGLAHEINNPIGNVVGYAKMILKDSSLNDKQRERLEIISEQAEKAGDIVQGLLNYSRQQEPKMERISINNVIESVIRLVSPQIEKNNIKVNADLKDVPAVKADFRQIEQVLFNIILNSIQAIGSDGDVGIRTSETGDGFVEVRIEDTGPGIPEEHIHKIFDPFFTTKPVNEGTGLGLSVCMGIIREHNGFIDVESEYGKGTAFIIKLPAAEDKNV